MTDSKQVDVRALVAIHQRAWNREMTRQQHASEQVSHIKATRAALKALGVAELIEAAKEAEANIALLGMRSDRLSAALSACTPAKEEGR